MRRCRRGVCCEVEQGPPLGWGLLGRGFRDNLAKGSEAGGEPCHASMKQAESGYAAAVGDYVCRLKSGVLIGSEKDFDFLVHFSIRSSFIAPPNLLEHRPKLIVFSHTSGGLQSELGSILRTRSSNKSYTSSASFEVCGEKVHTSVPLVALVVVCNDLGYYQLRKCLVLRYGI